jgi:hypothetical protein
MKQGNRYFKPLTFNLLAVVWILGMMPIAVAFVANVGSDPDNVRWEQITKEYIELNYGEGKSPINNDPTLCGNSFTPATINCTGRPLSWVLNGGLDLSSYYEYVNPNSSDWEFDCLYIIEGVCRGAYDPQNSSQAQSMGVYFTDCDTTGFWYNGQAVLYDPEVQYNCQFANENWYYYDILLGKMYSNELIYDGSYFYRGNDAHWQILSLNPNNVSDQSWAGESGDTFSFRLNELMMHQFPQGEMIDSLRLTFFDFPNAPLAQPTHHNCNNYAGWANLSIDTKISFQFDGQERELSTTYTTLTDNKWYYEAQNTFFPQSGCYIGYEVLIDFNGFDAREAYNFVDNGKWNESSMIITMTYERTDGQPLGSTNLAINGIDDFQVAIDYTGIEAQQVEFATNAGLLTIGSANIVFALASTPYWDPFRNFFKGRL